MTTASMRTASISTGVPARPGRVHPTKQRLLDVGLGLLLEYGYNGLGIHTLLVAGGTPKGSFYHHFVDKEEFALQVIDEYMSHVHVGLAECLGDESLSPLQRVRHFFELTQVSYQGEGYRGCLLGGLGQELSATNETFRLKVADCFAEISAQIAVSLEQARAEGELRADVDPAAMASLLIDCWEGAALRSRLQRDPKPLTSMLDFYFQTAAG